MHKEILEEPQVSKKTQVAAQVWQHRLVIILHQMKARGDSLGPQERPKWVTICSITSMERKGVWCLGEEMCAQRMLAVCV